MMIKGFTLIYICAVMVSAYGYAQQPLKQFTLQAAIDIAVANNLTVKQNDLITQTQKINAAQAKNNRLPVVDANINYGLSSGRSIDPFTNSYINQRLSSSSSNVNASVPLFNGFRIRNAIKQTEFAHQASLYENLQAKNDLKLNVILAFLQVLNDEDVLDLTRQQVLLTEKQVERLELLNNEGAISPSLLFDMKGEFASDQLAIVNARNTLETSKLVLAQLMNVSYDTAMKADRSGIEITISKYNGTIAGTYDTAIHLLPLIKAAGFRMQAAAKGIKVASAERYPQLSLFGQLNTNYSGAARNFALAGENDFVSQDFVVVNGSNIPVVRKEKSYTENRISYLDQVKNNFNTFAGVSLRIPIFNALQTKTNISLARIEQRNAVLSSDISRQQLKQQIEQAFVSMNAAYERSIILQQQVTAFQESFRSAEIKFNLGAINTVEYLIVKNNLDRANINLTVARYEYLLRMKVIEHLKGNYKL